jgi:hypothetical protein
VIYDYLHHSHVGWILPSVNSIRAPLAPVPKATAATTSTSTMWLLGGAAVLGAIGIAYAVKRPAGGPSQRNPRRRHSNRTHML